MSLLWSIQHNKQTNVVWEINVIRSRWSLLWNYDSVLSLLYDISVLHSQFIYYWNVFVPPFFTLSLSFLFLCKYKAKPPCISYASWIMSLFPTRFLFPSSFIQFSIWYMSTVTSCVSSPLHFSNTNHKDIQFLSNDALSRVTNSQQTDNTENSLFNRLEKENARLPPQVK